MKVTQVKVAQEWVNKSMAAAKVRYHRFTGTTTTVCLITLANGFSMVGTSDCIHAEDDDGEFGKAVAKAMAEEQIWKLEGYHRKASMAEAERDGR
jgi:hypothetical protein